TFQAGKNNSVLTDQVSKLANGKNNSGNVQVGRGNTAATSQTNSPPNKNFTTADFTNNSFSAQFGVKNNVNVGQEGGKNSQATIQAGEKNDSAVAQTNKSVSPAAGPVVSGANTAFTGQFGSKNTAVVSQTSDDGLGDAKQLENGHGNASASIQIGSK